MDDTFTLKESRTIDICRGIIERGLNFNWIAMGRVDKVTKEIAEIALKALDVDQHGLDDMDNRILRTIIEKFSGGPVGISTIATACGEEGETIEEVYEPFLIQEGYIKRTSRGRETTELAYKHLGLEMPGKTGTLF